MRTSRDLTPLTDRATVRTGLTFALRPTTLRPTTLLLTIGSFPLPLRDQCTG